MIRHRKTYCSVAKCRSGRNDDRKKRKKLGIRQISLFRVPKDLSLREQWSKILGQTLIDVDCICELHFPLDVIDMYHNIFFPNGVVQRYDKVRYSLKPNALPLREKRQSEEKTDDPIDNTVPTYTKLEIIGSHSLFIEDKKSEEHEVKQNRVDQINELLCLSEVNIGLHETIASSANEIIDLTASDHLYCGLGESSLQENNTCRISKSPIKVSNKSNDTHNSIQSVDIEVPIILTKSQYDHCYHLKSHEIENSYVDNEKERIPMSQKVPMCCNITKKVSNPTKNALILQSNQKHYISKKRALISNENTSVTQKNQMQQDTKKRKIEIAKPKEVLKTQTFNLNAIRDYFVKNPLPKSWTWIENKKYNGIIFLQISRFTQQIRCYVECKEDLSIELSTFDRRKISNMDCVVTSIDDILNYLMKVYNLRLCEANGVNEKRSENCSLLLNEQELCKKKMPVDRCSNCRNEKKPTLNRCNESKVKVNVSKNHELSQKLYQATRSCEYYREKCDSMKEMLRTLKKLCVTMQSNSKKTALDEAINQLPSVQQEVVRACFNSINLDPGQQRYEPNYAYECFLLKAVSEAAYDHIKKRNLLPLPCENTLKMIVGEEPKT